MRGGHRECHRNAASTAATKLKSDAQVTMRHAARAASTVAAGLSAFNTGFPAGTPSYGVDATQPHAECAGHRRLRMSRVRTVVVGVVAPPDAPCMRAVLARARRSNDDRKSREPRRKNIRDVVHTRRDPAEVGVRRLAMADHRVERVDGLVCQSGRNAADQPDRKAAPRYRRTCFRQASRSRRGPLRPR